MFGRDPMICSQMVGLNILNKDTNEWRGLRPWLDEPK